MHMHRTRAHTPTDPVDLNQTLLGLLVVHDHPTLWSMTELGRTLASSDEACTGTEPCHADVEDAVADLYAAGLIHRIGQFVFATRAAYEAARVSG
jgi:hypothetical protein